MPAPRLMRARGTPTAATPDSRSAASAAATSMSNAFSVLGIDPSATAVGPLSAVTLSEGRGLDADDTGENVAVLDATYAASNDLAVGDTIDVGGTDMEIVGIVTSTSSEADTAANVYIPLDVAQTLAGVEDVVSTVYVQADIRGRDRGGAVRHRGGAARRDRELAVRPRFDRLGLACQRVGAHLEPRHVAVDPRAGGGARPGRPVHDLGRLTPHPRVRHAEGHRLVERPRGRPGGGGVRRAGAARRRGRASRWDSSASG